MSWVAEPIKIIGILAASIVVVIVLSPVSTWLARRRLERWAQDQRLQLVAFKTTPFWRGPRAWLRTENQEDYFVVVEDVRGQRRTGWVLYTWAWHSLGSPRVEVRWDEMPQDVEGLI